MTNLDSIRRDCRAALRFIRKDWAISLTVFLTLALGIGGNLAVVGLTDEVFWHERPGIRDASTLRRLYVRTNQTIGGVTALRPFAFPDFAELSSRLAPLARTEAYSTPDSVLLSGQGPDRFIKAAYASSGFLPLLGARTSVGRFFGPVEDRVPHGENVVVVSHELASRLFHDDRSALGKPLTIDHQSLQIIGVTEARFIGPDLEGIDAWIPLATLPGPPVGTTPWYGVRRSVIGVALIARPVAADVQLAAAATASYRAFQLDGGNAFPDSAARVVVGPLNEALGPKDPSAEFSIARIIGAATLILFAVAVANVANVLLVRARRQRNSIAVRLALGATRWRLIQTSLIESACLVVLGAAGALAVGSIGEKFLRVLLFPGTEMAPATTLAWHIAASSLVLGGLVCFGVVALNAMLERATPLEALPIQALRTSTSHTVGAIAVGVQAGLSVILLVGAGLFVRSLRHVQAVDLGYDASTVISASTEFVNPEGHYIDRFREANRNELAAGLRDVASRLARAPGVAGTALATSPPMNGYGMTRTFIEDASRTPRPAPELNGLDPAMLIVSPSFFAVAGQAVLGGRGFDSTTDGDGAPPVAIVNVTAAQHYWPGQNPVGQCLRIFAPTLPCWTVIGVVGGGRLSHIVEAPNAEVFLSLQQRLPGAGFARPQYIIVRAASPDAVPRAELLLRQEMSRALPRAEPPAISALQQTVDREQRPWKIGRDLFGVLAGLALAMALVGIYGVVAYSVASRTRELAIRSAFGASPAALIGTTVTTFLRPIVVGITLGAIVALEVGHHLENLLYGITPYDPVALSVSIGAMVLAGVGACLLPALRAGDVDIVGASSPD